jgi:hypothetical protein
MDPGQTARMRRVIWIHDGRKPIMLVLSWRGSNIIAEYQYNLIWRILFLRSIKLTIWSMLFILQNMQLALALYNIYRTQQTLYNICYACPWTFYSDQFCMVFTYLIVVHLYTLPSYCDEKKKERNKNKKQHNLLIDVWKPFKNESNRYDYEINIQWPILFLNGNSKVRT